MSVQSSIKELKEAFNAQNPKRCAELTQKAIDFGADPMDLLEKNLLELDQRNHKKRLLRHNF